MAITDDVGVQRISIVSFAKGVLRLLAGFRSKCCIDSGMRNPGGQEQVLDLCASQDRRRHRHQ